MNKVANEFNDFSSMCRSIFLQLFDLDVDSSDLTLNEFQALIISISKREKSPLHQWIFHLLEQVEEYRYRLMAMKEIYTKSVLSEDPSFDQPSLTFFNEISDHEDRFCYSIEFEEKNHFLYLSTRKNHFDEKDFSIDIVDHQRDSSSLMNYSFEEKYSFIYQIQLKRLITYLDQLIIAIPIFPFSDHLQYLHSSKSSQQRIFIRLRSFSSIKGFFLLQRKFISLERRFDRLMYLPVHIEMFEETSYAIFSLRESYSHFTVEALLCYPFETLKSTHFGKKSLIEEK